MERNAAMTVEEIKEEKEKKKFLRRQKERLFAIVDHVDKIDDLTTHLHLRSSKDTLLTQ